MVIDKFNEVLVLQTLGLGVDRCKPLIVRSLLELFDPVAVVERNDAPVREKEGLDQVKGVLYGTVPSELQIEENWPPDSSGGPRFLVDVLNGQKTGHFLDQVANHSAIRPLCAGARVLDLFTHTGGFAIHAARYGAIEVKGLDIGVDAVATAQKNAMLNGCTE